MTATQTAAPTAAPTGRDADGADAAVSIDGGTREQLDLVGLPALVQERTEGDWLRIAACLGDPMATDSRGAYAAWLRRQATAWTAVRLPTVPVAALDWPLASVRPQCLDVVGLIVTDLRELAPRNHPRIVPAQSTRHDLPPHGTVVAAALLCVRVAEQSARLLGAAQALTAGTTALGSPTRYLARCADLAGRAPGLDREVRQWAERADACQLSYALQAADRFTRRLADALEAATRTGW